MQTISLEWVGRIFSEYAGQLLNGTWVTLYTTLLGTILGILLGFVIGVIKSTPITSEDGVLKRIGLRIVKGICAVYVEVFRDTPMMVQAMVLFYGIRAFTDITPVTGGILVILLNTGAYMAETVRGGIQSVDPGQREGAAALGMGHLMCMFNVILPQTFMHVLPEIGNMFLTNLKMTSVLNTINLTELYFVGKTAAANNYRFFESYLVIAIVYFVLCFIFARLIKLLEKKLQGKQDYELTLAPVEGAAATETVHTEEMAREEEKP